MQGAPGHNGCRRAQSFWGLGVPKCITSTATLLGAVCRHHPGDAEVLKGAGGRGDSRGIRGHQVEAANRPVGPLAEGVCRAHDDLLDTWPIFNMAPLVIEAERRITH